MKRMQRTTRLLAYLALAIVLVGCSTPTAVVAPTQDIPAIRTEAAQTVVAKITIEAALNPPTEAAQQPTTQPPTAEPQVITATAAPTATALPPTATLVIPPTSTLIPTLRPSTGNPAPTVTRRAGPNQAQYVSQQPADGANFNAGEEFDGAWTVKNIGTSTWNTNYYYRFNEGTNFAKADRYYIKGNVSPGDTVTLYADMQAPSEAGRYVSNWELCNDNGDVFFTFFMVIDVE